MGEDQSSKYYSEGNLSGQMSMQESWSRHIQGPRDWEGTYSKKSRDYEGVEDQVKAAIVNPRPYEPKTPDAELNFQESEGKEDEAKNPTVENSSIHTSQSSERPAETKFFGARMGDNQSSKHYAQANLNGESSMQSAWSNHIQGPRDWKGPYSNAVIEKQRSYEPQNYETPEDMFKETTNFQEPEIKEDETKTPTADSSPSNAFPSLEMPAETKFFGARQGENQSSKYYAERNLNGQKSMQAAWSSHIQGPRDWKGTYSNDFRDYEGVKDQVKAAITSPRTTDTPNNPDKLIETEFFGKRIGENVSSKYYSEAHLSGQMSMQSAWSSHIQGPRDWKGPYAKNFQEYEGKEDQVKAAIMSPRSYKSQKVDDVEDPIKAAIMQPEGEPGFGPKEDVGFDGPQKGFGDFSNYKNTSNQ